MSLDKRVADRRRFARLLGTDDAVGSGLPVGPDERNPGDERNPDDERNPGDAERDSERDADAGRRTGR